MELLCKSPKKPLSSGAHRTAQGLGKKKGGRRGKNWWMSESCELSLPFTEDLTRLLQSKRHKMRVLGPGGNQDWDGPRAAPLCWLGVGTRMPWKLILFPASSQD